MKFIKKHKVGLIVTVVCIILLILVFFAVKTAFFSNYGKSEYGNRLDGIENYPIEDKLISEIKEKVMETNLVENFSYDLKGRIMIFIIKVKNDVDLTSSHSLADKIAENISDEIKSFYDIQVMITSVDEESELYPTIGYKHKTSVGFKWNNG